MEKFMKMLEWVVDSFVCLMEVYPASAKLIAVVETLKWAI